MAGRERQELHGFLGVNLRKDRLGLADEEMARSINGDLHSQLGALVVRLGRTKQFTTPLTSLAVRRLAKINGCRYQVAGQSVYRDSAAIIGGSLSANLLTTLLPFRPLNDSTIWAFVADDAVMRKDACSGGGVTRIWGIAAPIPAPTTLIGALPILPTGLTGAYLGAYTYIRFDGVAVAHEGNPVIAAATTLANQTLAYGDMTHPSDPQVNGLGIYRSVSGGAVTLLDSRETIPTTGTTYSVTHAFEGSLGVTGLQHHWSVALGTLTFSNGSVAARASHGFKADSTGSNEDALGYRATHIWEIPLFVTTQTKLWAYGSSKADTALGTSAETDNDMPPLASWVAEYQGFAFLCRDAVNPDRLWFSKRYRPEAVPSANFLTIGSPDDPLQCAVKLSGLLAALTRKTKYRIVGSSAASFVAQEALSARGTPAPMAVIATERGLIFPARDGVFVSNVIAADEEISQPIAQLFFNEAVNDYNPINWNAALTMSAAYYKGKYFLSLPTGTNTSPDLLAVYSTTTQRWYFYDHPCRSLFAEEDTGTLTAGFTDGLVYVLEDATATDGDAGSNIAVDWQTADRFGASSSVRKLFLWAKVDIDALTETATVDLYVDGVVKRTISVTGTRTRILFSFPGGSMGYTWRVRVRYSGKQRVRWYGAEAIWLPLEAA